jgi:hypothetical protein
MMCNLCPFGWQSYIYTLAAYSAEQYREANFTKPKIFVCLSHVHLTIAII